MFNLENKKIIFKNKFLPVWEWVKKIEVGILFVAIPNKKISLTITKVKVDIKNKKQKKNRINLKFIPASRRMLIGDTKKPVLSPARE